MKTIITENPLASDKRIIPGMMRSRHRPHIIILVESQDGFLMRGTVVYNSQDPRDIGRQGSHWIPDDFVPFNGTLTMSNE